MNEHTRNQAEWLWGQLQCLLEKAEKKEMHPLLVAWTYLRFAASVNFERAPDTGAAMSVALQTLSAALEESRQEDPTDTHDPTPHDPIAEIPPGAHLH